jgi:hypothetical protein
MIIKFKLFENPDTLKDEISDRYARWSDSDAISFGYYKTDLIVKRLNDDNYMHYEMLEEYFKNNNIDEDDAFNEWLEKHPESKAYSSNSRQLLDYCGRLWFQQKLITFWNYPENIETLLKVLKEVLNVIGVGFYPEDWIIEVISEEKEELAKKVGKWSNDKREDYLISVLDYKSSGKRDKDEFNQEHELSPILKNTKKPEGWSPKKFKYQLPGESEVEARARVSKYVYQENIYKL